MAISDSFAETILKGAFGAAKGSSAPANFYLALSTTTPTYDDGDITNITEPSGGDYARVTVANNGTNFTVSGRTAENATAIEWPTATGSWGTVTHVVIYTAATAGSPLFFGSLASSASITTGIRFVIDPAGATINIPTS